jgi:hypothetical protein
MLGITHQTTWCYTQGQNRTDGQKLKIYIWEVFGSNLSKDTDILSEVFHAFPQFFQANVVMIPQLGHDCFLPNPFQFINHPTIRLFLVWLLIA